MPAGWRSDTSGTPGATGYCLKSELDDAVKPSASVYRAFKQEDAGPFLAEKLRRYPSPAEASQAIAYVSQLARSCASFSRVSKEGIELTYQLSPVSLPPMGDESVALTLTATGVPQVGTVQVAYAFWRRGDTVIQLDYTVIGEAQPSVEALRELTGRADGALSRPSPTP